MDLRDALVKFLPHLRCLSLSIGASLMRDESTGELVRKKEKTWWRIRRHEANGEIQVLAEAIPQSQFEALRDCLRGLDYESLVKLKPDEIESNCNV